MSAVPARLRPLPSHEWFRALVRVGVAEFQQRCGLDDGDTRTLLQAEARGLLRQGGDRGWAHLRQSLEQVWPPRDGALGRLIADLGLQPWEAFILSLLGEIETSHRLNLAMTALQAPDGGARPGAHTCVAMIDSLFEQPGFGVQDLLASALLQRGLVAVEGEGPAPLRSLRVEPALWSVLCGREQPWPGCHWLPAPAEGLLPSALDGDLPKLAALLAGGVARGLVIRGNPGCGRRGLAAALAVACGRRAMEIPVEVWSAHPALASLCVCANWLPVLAPDLGPGETWRDTRTQVAGPMLVLLGSDGAVQAADLLEVAMPLPTQAERLVLWKRHLQVDAQTLEQAASALLSAPAILRLSASARLIAGRTGNPAGGAELAEARAAFGAERLRLLAQAVPRRVPAAALVVPESVRQSLDALIERARRRELLWQGLGVTLQSTPNPGLRAVFVGDSGTGKTLAASHVATELGAPLYRVDLAAVMNKYVGESEKNLSALLDQAAASDVVLLFDEADSLFGRRTEGRETGERYANMLTNFLLTRIENHPGIVILTTNSRERLDGAFSRRLDLIIEFPGPSYSERLRLWQSHLGESSPGDAVCEILASYCDLSGGQIRNVVLTAAARREPGAGQRIAPDLLLDALRREYQKHGRVLPSQVERLRGAP